MKKVIMKLVQTTVLFLLFLECFSAVSNKFKASDPTLQTKKHHSTEKSDDQNRDSQPAKSKDANNNNPNLVSLNFENADVQSVIKAISKLSGKNFVIDTRVKGTINIISEKPIAKADSYKVLEAALRMQGFATIEANGVIKVLPENEARTYGMKVISNKGSTHGDQFITKVFVIDKVPVGQIATSIKPLVGNNSVISTYGPANCLIVSDYQSNMDRITAIIDSLVNTSHDSLMPTVIHLEYILASDAMQTLQPYMNGGSSSGGGGAGINASSSGGSDNVSLTIVPDNNTNSLFITSSSPSRLAEIKNIIKLLDVKSKDNNNNYHIIYLKNADAAHIADVLRSIAYNQEDPDMQSSNSNRYLSDTSSMMQGASGGGGSGSSPYSDSSKSSAAKHDSKSGGATGSQDKNAAKIFIQAEPTVNALIIEAPDATYRHLRHMVELLDVRRPQIMIEALIVDVNLTDAGSFGIQWAAVVPGGAGLANYGGADGGTLLGKAAAATAFQKGDAASAAALATDRNVYIGLVSGVTSVGGKKIPSVAALADMIAENANTNTLGRPTILTLDNEEASILVGQNIALPTGSVTNNANSQGGSTTTYQRFDIGTSLKIKPLIIEDGTIQLSIYQEDSKEVISTIKDPAGASLDKRSLKTQILVNDGQMIAIGGMISDELAILKSGIPFLGDIPYLGWLFSWQSRKHVKKSLFIFLRPVIIRNSYGQQALTNEKYQYIVGQEKIVHGEGNIMLPKLESTTLDNQVPWAKNQPPKGQSRAPYMNQAIKNDHEGVIDLRNAQSDAKLNGTPPATETILK